MDLCVLNILLTGVIAGVNSENNHILENIVQLILRLVKYLVVGVPTHVSIPFFELKYLDVVQGTRQRSWILLDTEWFF